PCLRSGLCLETRAIPGPAHVLSSGALCAWPRRTAPGLLRAPPMPCPGRCLPRRSLPPLPWPASRASWPCGAGVPPAVTLPAGWREPSPGTLRRQPASGCPRRLALSGSGPGQRSHRSRASPAWRATPGGARRAQSRPRSSRWLGPCPAAPDRTQARPARASGRKEGVRGFSSDRALLRWRVVGLELLDVLNPLTKRLADQLRVLPARLVVVGTQVHRRTRWYAACDVARERARADADRAPEGGRLEVLLEHTVSSRGDAAKPVDLALVHSEPVVLHSVERVPVPRDQHLPPVRPGHHEPTTLPAGAHGLQRGPPLHRAGDHRAHVPLPVVERDDQP